MIYKKILKYLLYLLPWFISGILFTGNTSFYETLNLPFFAPPSNVFPIVWTILYFLIATSIYLVIDKSDIFYKRVLYINYLFNQLYPFFFFKLESPLLGFLDCFIVLITGYLLYRYTKDINKKISYLLIPYLLWSLFATILSFSILLMN